MGGFTQKISLQSILPLTAPQLVVFTICSFSSSFLPANLNITSIFVPTKWTKQKRECKLPFAKMCGILWLIQYAIVLKLVCALLTVIHCLPWQAHLYFKHLYCYFKNIQRHSNAFFILTSRTVWSHSQCLIIMACRTFDPLVYIILIFTRLNLQLVAYVLNISIWIICH